MLSEDQLSKIIQSRAVTSSRKGHFRGGCLYMIKSANAECKVTSGSPWLGGKLACWHWGSTKPTLDSLCFPCLSGAAVHATRQPRPHKPRSIPPLSNVSINCRAVTNGVQLTENTLALTGKPQLLMDVIRRVKSHSRLFRTTVPLPLPPSTLKCTSNRFYFKYHTELSSYCCLMLRNLDCFSDKLIPEEPCKHEVSLFMNFRGLAGTTGEKWFQTVLSSCTGAKESAMCCSRALWWRLTCIHSVPPPRFHSGHKKTSLTFRLLQCFKTCKGMREFIIWRKKVWEKRKHGSGTKAIIIWLIMPDVMDHANAVHPLWSPWLHFACVVGQAFTPGNIKALSLLL